MKKCCEKKLAAKKASEKVIFFTDTKLNRPKNAFKALINYHNSLITNTITTTTSASLRPHRKQLCEFTIWEKKSNRLIYISLANAIEKIPIMSKN